MLAKPLNGSEEAAIQTAGPGVTSETTKQHLSLLRQVPGCRLAGPTPVSDPGLPREEGSVAQVATVTFFATTQIYTTLQ